MRTKGLNPSTLPSLVNDVVNRPKLSAVPSIGGSRDGKVRCVQVKETGRWRQVYDDEVLYGIHTEWRSVDDL
jgi:hypothetical protein